MESQLFKPFVNNISKFVFWKDRESIFLGCNQNFANSAGLNSPAEIIGKTDYDMPWTTKEANWYRLKDKEVMDSGEAQLSFEEPITIQDGSLRWLSTSKVPIFEKGTNKVIGILGWYLDITETKALKIEIDKKNSTLLEYSNQLKESKSKLEIANFDLEKFTYSVSHDLKAPINSIISFSKLAQKRAAQLADKKLSSYLDYVIQSGNRMSNLVTNILNFARTGAENLVAEETDIQALIERKNLDLEKLLQSKAAEVKIAVSKSSIKCYPHLLGSLFYNLVSNGIKFNTSEKPLVTCSCTENENDWEFSIQDNGIGINEEYEGEAFEAFSRLSSDDYEGSGLGLSICKRIVNIHKGKIWFENNKEGGTNVKFTISKQL